jgi:hypothetical protein
VILRVQVYAVLAVLDAAFAVACVQRAWRNHLKHQHARWSLILLAVYFGGTALDRAARIQSALWLVTNPAASRALLESYWFLALQVSMMAALIGLFFVLQTPRRDDPHDRAGDTPTGREGTA